MTRADSGAAADADPPLEVKVTDRRSAALDADDPPPQPPAAAEVAAVDADAAAAAADAAAADAVADTAAGDAGNAAGDADNDAEPSLQEQLQRLERRHQDVLNRLTRAQADFANYRRRTQDQASDAAQAADRAFALELLRVVDAFERAFAALPAQLHALTWVEGILLVYQQVGGVLGSKGVEPIACNPGDAIDVEVHEVVMTEGDAAAAVVEEVQRGYRMHGRVIRPALVRAGPAPPDDEAPAEADDHTAADGEAA